MNRTTAPAVMRRALLAMLVGLWSAIAGAAAGVSERWIVINAHVAEIVVALGGAERIVAVGGGADHLPELARVPSLPGFRQTSAEPMLALAPTHLLVTDDRVAPSVLEQLRAAGVRLEPLDGEQSLAGVERRIRHVARLLGKTESGEALVARLRREMADLAREVAQRKQHPRAVFILAGGKRPLIVAGRGTSAGTLLELAGARNVAGAIEGFKPMSQEAMIEAAPEVILTNHDGLSPTADGVPIVLKAPGALATPAGRAGRVIHIADRYLGGLGIHTPEGLRLLLRELDSVHRAAVRK